MKLFNVVLVATLAAFANAAAVPNPEPALTNPLEKRCKGTRSLCTLSSQCCNGACVGGTTINKFVKYCN
ncbi:uncharacterized protein N7500_002590 [Penicillium coprophilum]|uniref:uncharacterized protein n=1 Tax=Penicillium coprophilum TaxID=36646 RepID=UPI002397546F|nr:uncharacterized protein N7500_002590 [Penicillium coprophilum]KAJ5169807.1 hypothetical protein N7500_002590 [Penicillium coprophilum]